MCYFVFLAGISLKLLQYSSDFFPSKISGKCHCHSCLVLICLLSADSKAELRALEEGDGSAGGSSPCSETSQDASGSRGLLLKKNRWRTAFPCAASPDSNSRGSDLQDNTEAGEKLHTKY